MRNTQRWFAGLMIVAGVVIGATLAQRSGGPSFNASVDANALEDNRQPRALLRIVNEGVGPIHGLVCMGRSTWAFLVPLHEVRDLSLPAGSATVEIAGDPNDDRRAVTLVGGQTTTIEHRGER